MAKEVTPIKNVTNLPAYLQGMQKESFGNIDRTDLIIPRVKLLQAISPEVEEFDNAKNGVFWHTIEADSLGKELVGIPIFVRKSFVLWAPRNDDRGIMARSRDGIHWDAPKGTQFTVRPKGSPNDITYTLGDTVHERINGAPALSEFGSSIPGDPNSQPAAALTYEMLWVFPDRFDLGPAIIINTRSSVKPAKELISKIELKPVSSYAQKYKIIVTQQKGDEGPFNNYKYVSEGYADEEEFRFAQAVFNQFKDTDWKANDEADDADKSMGGAATPDPEAHKESKF